jgi:branched-chain amino acid transport system substrate-binding protein
MRGAMLSESTAMKNGVDLAVAEVGGVAAGYCLEVINLDDSSPQTGRWDGAVEAENANRAVADPAAIAYIGTYNSGAAKVSMPINNRAHLAQISPATTYPGLTKKRGGARGEPEIYRPMGFVNFFRVPPADDIQGAVGARWAHRLGHRKAYVLNDGEPYGQYVANAFEMAARAAGLEVVANEAIDSRASDHAAVLGRVGRAGADLVFFGGLGETGGPAIIRQMRDLGLVAPRAKLMGADGLYEDEVLTRAGCEAALATEMRFTLGSVPLERLKGTGARLYQAYRRTYGKDPTGFALHAADAARIAIEGINRAAAEIETGASVTARRDAVRKAIAGIRNFAGIHGPSGFDENGDTTLTTMSGFRVAKASTALGCGFQFETLIE